MKKCNGDELNCRLISSRGAKEIMKFQARKKIHTTNSFTKNFGLITKVRGYTKGLMGGGAVKYADKT